VDGTSVGVEDVCVDVREETTFRGAKQKGCGDLPYDIERVEFGERFYVDGIFGRRRRDDFVGVGVGCSVKLNVPLRMELIESSEARKAKVKLTDAIVDIASRKPSISIGFAAAEIPRQMIVVPHTSNAEDEVFENFSIKT